MKTNKTFAYGILTVIIALAFIACPAEKTPENDPPTANAGTDFEHDINNGTSITLDGSGSTGNNIVYAWECTKFPTGATKPFITNANTATPTVSGFDKLGNYEYTLKVTDSEGAESQPSVVKVLLYRTASTTIEVPSIAFSNNPVLNFVQTYTGYNSDFPSGCITYKIVDDKGHTWNNGDTLNATDNSLGYVHNEGIIFTQTFYHNNQEVNSRTTKVRFSSAGAGTFNAIDVNGSWASSGTIPSVSISLNEKVSVGDIS